MKRLWNVLILALAANFLAVAGAVGWLRQSGHLTRDRVDQIKLVLFPTTQPESPAAQPAPDPTTRPTLVLEELLAKRPAMTAGDQVKFIHQTFDERQAELGRRQQFLEAQQRQIDLAQNKLQEDRDAFEAEAKKFREEQALAKKLATDAGFQSTLADYSALPPKQVKGIFATLGDDVVRMYLEAMEPRAVAKIVKEYKTPDELDRIQKIMEKIRKAEPATRPING
jgi:hypothetical protein